MILYPPCKINLGLHILKRREDGYHDIETAMIPLKSPVDILEILYSTTGCTEIKVTGPFAVENGDHNLCYKAYQLLAQDFNLPPLKLHLHKQIPFGAGLGGGSADAAYTLTGIRDFLNLPLENRDLEIYAQKLGSDVPFFLWNTPMLATGRGEILTPLELDLKPLYITLIKPDFGISTAEAYSGITPKQPEKDLRTILNQDMATWKDDLRNDFEDSVFSRYPVLKEIKDKLYELGAVYAAMSGSGSTIFALSKTPLKFNCLNSKGFFITTFQF